MKLYLIPDIKCHYHFKGSFWHLARSNFKNGFWNILTCYITKKVSSLSLRHFVPFIFVLALIIPLLLGWFVHPALVYISLSIIVLYLLLIFLKSYLLTDNQTKLIYLILSFLILHFAYGIGSLAGLFYLKKLIKS
jgi:hypothetical protein